MSGSNTTLSKGKKKILAATAKPPQDGDFVWDGQDEDDRPLSAQEMRAGIKKSAGRPKTEHPKKQLTIRLDSEVIEYFRSQGQGWQSRINEALQEYMREHHSR